MKRKLLLIASIGIACVLTARAQDDDIRRDATVKAVEIVMPSVVNIATKGTEPVRDPFERLQRQMLGQPLFDEYISAGSGVVIDETGYLLTNDHVVRGADQIQVRFGTGTNDYDAAVIVSDPKADVALLKLKGRPGETFHAIKLAREDDLLLGETVLALGNPFGLGGSVTRGILSSKSRTLPDHLYTFLQTDAPINPGNSGGPLVNLKGELIGINTLVLNETANGEFARGIGFARPIRVVETALSEIFPTEFVRSSLWFGARVKVGSYPLVITSVQPASPAGHAGLQVGDVVMQVNGKVPKTFIEFGDLLASNAAADIPITVRRGDNISDVKVHLVRADLVFNTKMVQDKLGLTLEKSANGFAITAVEPGSPGSDVGLQPGMIVRAIDLQEPPPDVTGIAKLLYAKKKGETVRLDLAVIQQVGNFNVIRSARAELKPR